MATLSGNARMCEANNNDRDSDFKSDESCDSPMGAGHPPANGLESFFLGCTWYWLTLIPVLAGLSFGVDFLTRQSHPNWNEPGFLNAFGAWDGVWYKRIVEEGYYFDATRESSVAFFPAYPLLGKVVHWVTGLPAHMSLLIGAHLSLVGVFIVLATYVRARFPSETRLPEYVLIAFGLWPTTFYFRMTYSESLFVLVMLVAMLGMLRRWPAWSVALIIGLATACRPVGVALLPVLAWDLWDRNRRIVPFLLQGAFLMPVACWGLLAYMAYQSVEFGNALGFMHTQQFFTQPVGPLIDRLPALLMLEPLWSVYVPENVAYWAAREPVANPLYSLHFANPIWFGGTAILIGVGAWKGWLDKREWLLAATLLLIPYVTHSQRAYMMSHARYAAVVFPVFIILGRFLMRLPTTIQIVICGYSIFLLAIYSALFVSWYRFY